MILYDEAEEDTLWCQAVERKCEGCGNVMWVEATRWGGETLNSLEFFARIVRPEDQQRMREVEARYLAGPPL